MVVDSGKVATKQYNNSKTIFSAKEELCILIDSNEICFNNKFIDG